MKEIDRLRWKFMFYNMLIVTAVIGVTFCSAALLIKKRGRQETSTALSQAVQSQVPYGYPWQEIHQMEEQTIGQALEQTLEQTAEQASQFVTAADMLIFDMYSPVRVPYFSVFVKSDGMVVLRDGAYNSFPSREFVESVAGMGLKGTDESGKLDDYSLRYLRVSYPTGYLIAFADTTYEESMLNEMLVNGGIVCGIIWLGFLALSYVFARWAVRPVEASVRQQKQFVADASHELKTPLTVITANAELLKERCQGMEPEVDKWLENVNQECVQMRHLVENLLMLARNDVMKKSRNDWKVINFSDMMMEELLIFEPVFYQMGKTIEYKIEDGLSVRGNPGQLKQVVKVLLDNAVKYSSDGARTEVCLESSGKRKLCLWVKSEGNIIPKEQRKAIFQRFYRGDASHSTQEGYGLGLAIAQEIVRNHRGDIGVVCEGQKNCFYLKINRQKKHTMVKWKEKLTVRRRNNISGA